MSIKAVVDQTLHSNLLRKTLLLCSVLAGFASAPALAGGDHDNDGPTANTQDGPVRGLNENGVYKFLGIPYAAPPVGKLRWQPPQSPSRHGLLDATQFANTCPQVTELGAFAGPSSVTEDCLYLNVFTTGNSQLQEAGDRLDPRRRQCRRRNQRLRRKQTRYRWAARHPDGGGDDQLSSRPVWLPVGSHI